MQQAWIIRRIDDRPEAIYDADEHDHHQCLSDPFRKCPVCGFDLAAGYRGFVGLGVSSEGAVVWRSTDKQWCGI